MHLAVSIVRGQAAVVLKGTPAVGAKFEDDRLSSPRSPGDAVVVDHEGVGYVDGLEVDFHQAPLGNHDSRRGEREFFGDDGERPDLTPVLALRGRPQKREEQEGEPRTRLSPACSCGK